MIEIDKVLAEKLSRAGLSDKESLIYSALVTSGGSYPSKVAEATKLNRTTVYKILQTLAVRGLVDELEKKNKLYYQVSHPRNIERYAQTRITQAKRELEGAQTILPKLEGLYAHSENKPIVKFYEGEDGVLKVYEEHITVKEPYEMLGFSNVAELMKLLDKTFRDNYIQRKAKIGITTRGIFPDTEADVNYAETIYSKVDKKFWPKMRHVPAKEFPYNAEITVYGKNKVSIINFTNGRFAGTIIEDQTIHDMMAMIFELSWNSSKAVR